MRKLYFTSCSYNTPHIGVLLDSMLDDKNQGNDVYWAYCQGVLKSCSVNPQGNALFCKLCRYEYKELTKAYGVGIHVCPINKSLNNVFHFHYTSAEEVKQIVYKDVRVGYSILSLYYTLTRNYRLEITEDVRYSFDSIINQMCNFIDQAYVLIDRINPDTISIYNGRYYEDRLFYDIALAKGINFESYEIVGGIDEPFYKVCFKGGLPHDTKIFSDCVYKVWKISNEDKEKIGRSFFEKRRAGMPAADKIYVEKQVLGLLPVEYSPLERNVVIFNSSDDEVAALGGEWEENKLFQSQYDAITFLLSNTSNEIHYYLRIHPNLANVRHSIVPEFYKLKERYSNITIIDPSSPISTYALMDIAEKVIVFGSTMGVESCYWGKPVILIGHSFYVHLDIAYHPTTVQEIIDIVNNKDLLPKKNNDAIKYGYFLLDRKFGTCPCHYIDINYKLINIMGGKIRYVSYLRLFGSKLLFKLIHILLLRYSHFFAKKSYTFGLEK